MKTQNSWKPLWLRKCQRQAGEKSFIRVGSLGIDSRCRRQLSTQMVTCRWYLGSHYQMAVHKPTSGLGTFSRGILETTKRNPSNHKFLYSRLSECGVSPKGTKPPLAITSEMSEPRHP